MAKLCCNAPKTKYDNDTEKNKNKKKKSKAGKQSSSSVKKRKKTIPASLRAAVWDKHVGEDTGSCPCPVCRHTKITQLSFHCAHIEAEANGGKTHVNNMIPVCARCNLSMGKTNLNDFKNKFFSIDPCSGSSIVPMDTSK